MQSSDIARALLLDSVQFEERERVEVNGLGPMTTYLLVEVRAGR